MGVATLSDPSRMPFRAGRSRNSRKQVVPMGSGLPKAGRHGAAGRGGRVEEAAYRIRFGASNNETGPGAACHFRTGQLDWQGNKKLPSESRRKGGFDGNRSRDPRKRRGFGMTNLTSAGSG